MTILGHDVTKLQILLFILTLVTTLIAGLELSGVSLLTTGFFQLLADVTSDSQLAPDDPISLSGDTIVSALMYSLSVMAILFCHEMGHYLTAKRYHVDVSTPYFMPALPIPGIALIPSIGTFGAFIKMEVDRISPNHLVRIAAWGPVAGYVVAIPVLFAGIAISKVEPMGDSTITLGNSLILMLGETIFHPNIPEGYDVMLSPLAMAGWFGVLLTSLNLIPVGQLDGGHIAYATFGKRWYLPGIALFIVMVIFGVFFFAGWLILAAIIAKLGVSHPDTLTPERMSRRDQALSFLSLLIFVTTFTPIPFSGLSLIDLF